MEDIDTSFEYFAGACQRLASIYQTIRELFLDRQEEVIPLLNRVAPRFFNELLHTYEHALFLGMARLSDPAETKIKGGESANLSVARICKLLCSKRLLSAEICALQDQLKIEKYRDISLLRNKHIAHLDSTKILAAEDIAVPSWKQIREYFVRLDEFVEAVRLAIGREKKVFLFAGRPGHVPRLLRHLEKISLDETVMTQELFREHFEHFDI